MRPVSLPRCGARSAARCVSTTDRARSLLEKVGLSHREQAYPHELSGGEQQRVAIARALAMSPEVLLLDEPTSALDPERIDDIIDLLDMLADEGLTLVTVTHEMSFARHLATRVIVLHGGTIVEEGDPDEVLVAPTDPRTRAFLGLDDPPRTPRRGRPIGNGAP